MYQTRIINNMLKCVTASGMVLGMSLAVSLPASAQEVPKEGNIFVCFGMLVTNPDLHKLACGVNEFGSGVGGSNYQGEIVQIECKHDEVENGRGGCEPDPKR